jgi:hypothetical protein
MMERGILRWAVLAAAISLAAACGGPSGVTEDPFPDRTELAIRDSIGVEMGDSVYVFGSIMDACRGPSGEILVVDQINCCVRVYDDYGRYVTQIGRSGEGPGEFYLPFSIACLDDGRIFVDDPMANSIVTFDSAYTYLENITDWSNGPPMDPTGLDGGSYAGMKLSFNPTDSGFEIVRTLGRFSDSIEPDLIYVEDPIVVEPTDFTAMINSMLYAFVHTGDHEGRFAYAPVSGSLYQVRMFDPEGNELFTITQAIPPVEKPASEIEDEKAYMESWMTRMGAQGVIIEWEPDPFRDMVGALGIDGEDRLWVMRGTELEPVFDVYGTDTGEHLFSAVLPRESASWKFYIDGYGMLAWEEDPPSGYQRLYIIDLPEI